MQGAIAALVASAPGTLDTLKELAAALGNDPNFATTVTNLIAAKLDKTANAVSATLKLCRTAMGIILQARMLPKPR